MLSLFSIYSRESSCLCQYLFLKKLISSYKMDHLLMNTRPLTYHAIFLLFLSLSISKFSSATTLSNETDKLALLEFKSHIDSPLNVLASWNDSFHFCHWVGVTCGNKHQRVIGLDFQNKKLVGTISPHIGNLSFLQSLNLASNSFHGGIPSEVGYFKMTYFSKILTSKFLMMTLHILK